MFQVYVSLPQWFMGNPGVQPAIQLDRNGGAEEVDVKGKQEY